MKKLLKILFIIILLFTVTMPVLAVKPTGTGPDIIDWNLSGDVMPVPPWGLSDIPGSNTASKLIVNQPNGNVEVAVTGVMQGLEPYTTYTVFPSNAWSASEKWNIVGDWDLRFMYGGAYDHNMTVSFQDMHTGYFSGTGTYIPNTGYTWIIEGTSRVVGNSITLDFVYTGINAGYSVHAVGTINSEGAIVNGTWSSSASQSGTWSSFSGSATKETVGNGWPGLFAGQETFTFTTDGEGNGGWHFNLKNEDFPGLGEYWLSVWINGGGSTILISDNFSVIVD
ncbi:MAG: hypothetical protein ABFS32_22085 [Bacteroidota bacterium]